MIESGYCYFYQKSQYFWAFQRFKADLGCWIIAGGAHHTVLSYDVSAEMLRDWARMMDIEFVHITKDTTPEKLEEELLVKDLVWRLK